MKRQRPDISSDWYRAVRTIRNNRSACIAVGLLAAMVFGETGCGKHGESSSEEGRSATRNLNREPVQALSDTSARYVTNPRTPNTQPKPGADLPPQPHLVQGERLWEITPAEHPAPKPAGPLPEEASCITAECHVTYLTAAHTHAPIALIDCEACHEQDTGGHVYPLKRPNDNDTCTFCHQIGNQRQYMHAAVDNPGCTGCHDPHASNADFLMSQPSVREVCALCHLATEGIFGHEPYTAGDCAACHQPHESNYLHLLRGGDNRDHCFTCHAESAYAIRNAPYVHDAVKEACTPCHAAHASDFEHHLNYPIEQVCFTCHRGLEEQVGSATAPHEAVFTADRCANCHDAHASGRPKMLKDRQTTLCLQCHNQPIVAYDGRTIPDMTASVTSQQYLHGPVESGDCAACHNVHGGTHSKLLRETFPATFYADFDLQSYVLCFSCHDRDLVLTNRADALTGFRDGDRNLHYLHVHRDKKGRTCKTCHAIHGSDLPKHIAKTVPFEGSDIYTMPIGFEKTESGGSCAPGCHEPKGYDRNVPANQIPEEMETKQQAQRTEGAPDPRDSEGGGG